MEHALLEYSKGGPEAARQAESSLFSIQNALKATRPRLTTLRGELIESKKREENELRSKLRERDDLRKYDASWHRVDEVEVKRAEMYLAFSLLEEGRAFGADLFHVARDLVRLVDEDAKPDSDRLPEYTQSKRESLEHRLFAEGPFYPELEIVKLATTLQLMRDRLGEGNADVKPALAGKSSQSRAEELIRGSKLGTVTERRRVRAGGAAEIKSSEDALIRLAVAIDADARRLRRDYEASISEPLTRAMAEINRARFALLGSESYPDATGTLRLAFGFVRGYEQDGHRIPAWTTMGGAFEHERAHGAKEHYKLPVSWGKAESTLDPNTPFNFVCTADITGGNSGSPIVNRAGEWVGLIFDSNRQGVVNDFHYSDAQARAVAVDARAIVEALRKIYGAETLAAELSGTAIAKH